MGIDRRIFPLIPFHHALGLVALVLIVLAFLRLGLPSFNASPPLLTRHISVEIHGESLGQAIEKLGQAAKTKIVFDLLVLRMDGFDSDIPVTLHVRDMELNRAFKKLMESTNLGAGFVLEPDGKGLVVKLESSLPRVVRVYDVRDLVDNSRTLPHVSEVPTFGFYVSGLSTSQPSGPAAAMTSSREELKEQLIRLLMEVTSPAKWMDAGGDDGQVETSGNLLIITARRPLQKEVAELLFQLRESDAGSSTGGRGK